MTRCCRRWFVAARMRTFTRISFCPPTRWNSCCSSTRRSFVCVWGGISPISSRKIVPPWASSNSPLRESIAPVNAPFSWPKSSLSRSVSERAATLTGIKDLWRRRDSACIPRATSSLPVPDSPVTSTVASTGAIWTTRSSTSSIASVSPTMPVALRRRLRSIVLVPTRTISSASAGRANRAVASAGGLLARTGPTTAKTGMPSRDACPLWRAPAFVSRPPVNTSRAGSSAPATSSPAVNSSTR